MKRILSIVLAAVLALGVFAIQVPTYNAASQNIKVDITPSPSALPEAGGKVDFAIEIENISGAQISGIIVKYGSHTLDDISDLGPTDKVTAQMKDVTISTSNLGKTLTFKISYTVNGASLEESFTTQVDKPKADLAVKCTVDRTVPQEGDKVNFTITLENVGEAKITGLVVTLPPLNSGKKISLKSSTLEPDKKMTVVYAYTIKDDVTVTPTVKYTAVGESFTVTKTPINLKVVNPQLELSLTSDTDKPASTDDEVTFTLALKNTGDTTLKDLKVYDHLQQELKLSSKTLKAGATMTLKNLKYTFPQTTKVEFSATADDADGQTYNFKSDDINITLPIDQSKVKMELAATADVTELTEPGTVKFKITLTNSGSYPLQSVVVTEDKLGEVGKQDTLEIGDKYFEKEAEVSATGTYTFKATAKDADGNTYNVQAAPIEIKLAAPVESTKPAITGATDVPLPSVTTGAVKGDTLGTIVIVMVVVIVLIIAVVIALVVLVNKEKRNQSRQKAVGQSKSVKYRNKNNF